jgi:dihydroorotase
LWEALLDGRIDVIATDHAPHTKEEKAGKYKSAPSGGPLVQHAVVAMFDKFHEGKISVEKIVEKMAHNPAILFDVKDRGYIREGYYADLVLVDPHQPWTVTEESLLYKCGWSPFTGHTFKSMVTHTFVNGQLVYNNGKVSDVKAAKRLTFNR